MANILQSFIDRKISKYVLNKFNEAFFGTMTGGGTYTGYDTQADVYLEQGYLSNPIVYSIINQRSGKAKQVPYFIKKVKDKKAKKELDNIKLSTKGILTPQQQFKSLVLKNKAFEDQYLDFPMDKPNTLQTWSDIIGLYETFMAITGNFYLYMLKGDFASNPLQVYVLPAHLMQIVLKPKADLMGIENPISHYMLIENNMGVKFEYDEVIHIKTPNPEYGTQGEHLYGLSPLRPAIRNIQSSNEGIDNNVRTMLNGGIFGFITGKNIALTPEQASAVKDTLSEMRSAKEHLSHVRGASSPLEFLKVSVDTEKLLPFAYQDFDQKQLCNVLGWDDKLLNNPDGAKYDNMAIAERRVLTSTVMPSLLMLQEKLNQDFLPLFKGYENAAFEFDITEMPEMQEDIEKLVVWLDKALASGVINRDEYREAIKYPKLETPEMQAYTVSNDLIPLAEAINEMQIVDERTTIS
jgi:HK97 family phage portal protein